jgi:ketosteroid isomerase-like protein
MKDHLRLFLCLSIALAILVLSTGSAVRAGEPKADPRSSQAQRQILAVLEAQAAAWNQGDIDSFVDGYWRSEETEFVGAKGVTKGFQAVVERYRRDYPDRSAMGQLSFSNLEVHVTGKDSAYTIGEFLLVRKKDQPSGFFTLNFRRFSQGWKIVADHTTARAVSLPPPVQ